MSQIFFLCLVFFFYDKNRKIFHKINGGDGGSRKYEKMCMLSMEGPLTTNFSQNVTEPYKWISYPDSDISQHLHYIVV